MCVPEDNVVAEQSIRPISLCMSVSEESLAPVDKLAQVVEVSMLVTGMVLMLCNKHSVGTAGGVSFFYMYLTGDAVLALRGYCHRDRLFRLWILKLGYLISMKAFIWDSVGVYQQGQQALSKQSHKTE